MAWYGMVWYGMGFNKVIPFHSTIPFHSSFYKCLFYCPWNVIVILISCKLVNDTFFYETWMKGVNFVWTINVFLFHVNCDLQTNVSWIVKVKKCPQISINWAMVKLISYWMAKLFSVNIIHDKSVSTSNICTLVSLPATK